jgi:hypothetical protein
MKKLLIVTNVIVISALLSFSSCEDTETPSHSKSETAANCYPPVANDYQFEGLNGRLVYKLAKNYKEKQLQAVQAAHPEFMDARSVWFDMATLKQFIHEVERQTCYNCDNNHSTQLGLRIYYGTYPELSEWNNPFWQESLAGLPADYAGKHTVMMVPTYRNNTGVDMDFDPGFMRQGCNFTYIDSFYKIMEKDSMKNFTFTILSSISTTSQNHGQMVPPPYTNDAILDAGAAILYAVDEYHNID